MKKETIIRIILWIAVVLWMALIFSFSSQNSTKSNNTSDSVVDVVDGFLDHIDPGKQNNIKKLAVIVRKSAHFAVFAVLGILVFSALYRYRLAVSKTACISFLICVLYAVSDEIHQHFVPGRACRVFDVAIDSAGSICGILAVFVFVYFLRHRTSRKTRP